MFPQVVKKIYTDGSRDYRHLDQVIYLSEYHCSFCGQVLTGIVDDFLELSTGTKISLCGICKNNLSVVLNNT